MSIAHAPWPRSGWRPSGDVVVIGLIGAILYAIFNWVSFDVLIPGTDDVSVRPHYGLLTFFGFACGPMVGLITGLLGNLAGDALGGFNPFASWWWSVANGLAGMFAGVIGAALVRPGLSRNGLLVAAAVAAVLATILGFAFIWIELVVQPLEMSAGEILATEYVPVVVGNSLAAAVMTPILVLAWRPLHETLAMSGMDRHAPEG
ncbi:MAG TPA: ECF transporter S component [candidate division Zixibacteria bacterium]|nr:ECF transporter S component [candidate division Zixibacteria bacterium]